MTPVVLNKKKECYGGKGMCLEIIGDRGNLSSAVWNKNKECYGGKRMCLQIIGDQGNLRSKEQGGGRKK